jgi:hypothetical protein
VAQGGVEVVGVAEDLAGGDGLSGPSHRGTGHPSELRGIVELAGQGGDPERGQPLGPGVGVEQLPGGRTAEKLGLEIGVRLLEQLDGLLHLLEHTFDSSDGV